METVEWGFSIQLFITSYHVQMSGMYKKYKYKWLGSDLTQTSLPHSVALLRPLTPPLPLLRRWVAGEQGPPGEQVCSIGTQVRSRAARSSGQHFGSTLPCQATRNTQTHSQPVPKWNKPLRAPKLTGCWFIAAKFLLNVNELERNRLVVYQMSFVNMSKLHVTLAKQQWWWAMHSAHCC